MKRIIFAVLFMGLAYSMSFAQSEVKIAVDEVMGKINEQTPALTEYRDKLDLENKELEERIIVLKYHKGNKEVSEACQLVVNRVEEYYNAVVEKVSQFESIWFDQQRNLVSIYTRYGELKEATGGGTNELADFATAHENYLQLIDNLKSDLIRVYSNIGFIKNSI